jgi:hypothetical protein
MKPVLLIAVNFVRETTLADPGVAALGAITGVPGPDD